MWGAKFFDENGEPVLSSDPAWASALQWQKQLIDYYGYDNIIKFIAAYGGDNEFSASNAFETGKVAMMFDGEWRTAFIKREHPELNYGTASVPGRPTTTPTCTARSAWAAPIVGIPQGSQHPDQAWLLVKFLSTIPAYIVHHGEPGRQRADDGEIGVLAGPQARRRQFQHVHRRVEQPGRRRSSRR